MAGYRRGEDAVTQPSADIIDLADQIQVSVNGGDTIEGAVRRLQRFVPADKLAEARLVYERRVGRIRDLRDPGALVHRSCGTATGTAAPRTTTCSGRR